MKPSHQHLSTFVSRAKNKAIKGCRRRGHQSQPISVDLVFSLFHLYDPVQLHLAIQSHNTFLSWRGEESVHTILLRTTTFHILSMTYFTMPRLRRNSTDDELFEPLPLPTAAYRNNLQAQQRLMADASSKHHYCSARRASCTALCEFDTYHPCLFCSYIHMCIMLFVC